MMPDRMLKVVLSGDQGVGKSALGYGLAAQDPGVPYLPTIGVEILKVQYRSKKGLLYYIQLWNTAGNVRFRSISSCFARGAFAQIYVFDKSDLGSFQSIAYWMAVTNASQCQLRILYGNCGKGEVEVPYEEAANFANQREMLYFEQSALESKPDSVVFDLIADFSEHY